MLTQIIRYSLPRLSTIFVCLFYFDCLLVLRCWILFLQLEQTDLPLWWNPNCPLHVHPIECFEFALPVVEPSCPSSLFTRISQRHSVAQGDLVAALVLTSERFYSPNPPGPRRMFTSTGTPLRVNWPKKPAKARLRSFLWDAQWDDPTLTLDDNLQKSFRHFRFSSDMEVSNIMHELFFLKF